MRQVAEGSLSVGEAASRLRILRTGDFSFAHVDTDRLRRCGLPEVIFCTGKTADQVSQIMATIRKAGQDVLATRASKELYEKILPDHPDARYHDAARAITVDVVSPRSPEGLVVVVSAGTSDLPVAEEACLAVQRMGVRVERAYDVGVAGIHRLEPYMNLLRTAHAVVVVAGMEGALPSVIGGLIDRPIVAVPTSIGYGLHLRGLTALLSMLNTCVPGISVVNVDNGFGGGVTAAIISRVAVAG